MKSWLSFLLPVDEYKEKRILYFFSEGAVILIVFLVGIFISNEYLNLNIAFVLLFLIATFFFYVSGRYIISGIEYTDIVTEQEYKKEISAIVNRTIIFVIIFIMLYLIFANVPSSRNAWFKLLGTLSIGSIAMFFASFISLNRSYKRNKELL
ncbi:DUF3278 domain-containing protein [Paraliobacillus sp. JSM ZJ581]|uniref:DUF3278 domain-containing protein n=1 Tax=Paraliobacillus sp. JSM ZJ581 TaxID=3342118 RepID=UPI0035A8B06B